MIQSIEVTNDLGETLVLPMKSPEQSGFFIKGISGLGPVKANINMSEVLSIPGGNFNSAHITTRNIVMDLGFFNWTEESIEEIRLKTYKYFPVARKCQIKVITDIRTGITNGYVESNEPNIFSPESSTPISIICESSYFYDSEVIQTLFSGIDPLFEFPFSNESLTLPLIEFGEILTSTQATVFYSGEVETGVVLHVNFLGAVTNPAFHNITQRQSMEMISSKVVALTGSGFVAGDELIISTIKGDKYIVLIRAGETINLLNALNKDATWFTLGRGDNLFYYEADSGVSNMQFRVEHNIYYEGM